MQEKTFVNPRTIQTQGIVSLSSQRMACGKLMAFTVPCFSAGDSQAVDRDPLMTRQRGWLPLEARAL